MNTLQRASGRASGGCLGVLLAHTGTGASIAGGNRATDAEVLLAGGLADAIGVELRRPGVMAEAAVKQIT